MDIFYTFLQIQKCKAHMQNGWRCSNIISLQSELTAIEHAPPCVRRALGAWCRQRWRLSACWCTSSSCRAWGGLPDLSPRTTDVAWPAQLRRRPAAGGWSSSPAMSMATVGADGALATPSTARRRSHDDAVRGRPGWRCGWCGGGCSFGA